ncbi:MAG: DUF1287 domain-containing protein [Parvibaculaceae bacterium]|nr:DUF1287 domain-containing protein [Parvibaculaceae bacterium]
MRFEKEKLNRRQLIGFGAAVGITAGAVGLGLSNRAGGTPVLGAVPIPLEGPAGKLISAARTQIGVTKLYDGAYEKLGYPGGDVPRVRGVCTDVIVRAYRDGLGVDLQQLVHEDMARDFSAYPARWGLKKPDRNIDHRRVPNLQAFFARHGSEVRDGTVKPGDLITQNIFNRPHIVIVSNVKSNWGARYLVIHNGGGGTEYDDWVQRWPRTGHYRFLVS